MHIIAIIDVDSAGYGVRLSDGEIAFLPHDSGCVPCIGEELSRDPATGRLSAVPGRMPHIRKEDDAQVAANILSQAVNDSTDEPAPSDPAAEA